MSPLVSYTFLTSMAESTQGDGSTIHSAETQDIGKPTAFDPQDVGIPLTRPQLILTFIGYMYKLFDPHIRRSTF